MDLEREHQSGLCPSPGRRIRVESIKAVFLLGKHEEDYVMEYLMRRYKGKFYRPKYPTLTLVN